MRVLPIVALFPFVVSLSSAIAADSKEINFDGKSLRKWLDESKSPEEAKRKQAQKALIEIVRANRDAARLIVETFLTAVDTIATEKDLRLLEAFGPSLYEIGSPAAKALHPYLWGTDRNKKRKALAGLALLAHHAKAAAPGLIEILENKENDDLLPGALAAVSRCDDPVFIPVLLRMLDDPDKEYWLSAARMLVGKECPPNKYLPTFRGWLRGDDETRRCTAVLLLKQLERAAAPATDDLIALLKKPEQPDQSHVIELLGSIGPAAQNAVPILEMSLTSDDAEIAFKAALALVQIAGHGRAKEVLVKAATNGKVADRLAAISVLWQTDRSPEAIAALKKLLESEDADERLRAAQLALHFGSRAQDLVPVLTKLSNDSNPDNRLAAIRALGRIGPGAKPALTALRSIAENGEETQRVFAVTALARIDPDETAIGRLVELLKSNEAWIRFKALGELMALGPKASLAVSDVRKRIDDPDAKNRSRACEALWLIDANPSALPELQKLLEAKEADVRNEAALVLGDLFGAGAVPAVPALVPMLWSDSWEASAAAETLGRIGPAAKQAVPALIRALQSENLDNAVYSASAEALGLFGDDAKPAVPALISSLRHHDPLTRVHAALALLRIAKNSQGEAVVAEARLSRKHYGYITALEAEWLLKHDPKTIVDLMHELRAAMVSDDVWVGNRCYMAARALGRIGPQAKAALPDLKDLLLDEDPALRRNVAAAIKEIEAKK